MKGEARKPGIGKEIRHAGSVPGFLVSLFKPAGWAPSTGIPLTLRYRQSPIENPREKKVARHSTALEERRYRCCLPALAEFTRLPMHGTWPTRTMPRFPGRATPISAGTSCIVIASPALPDVAIQLDGLLRRPAAAGLLAMTNGLPRKPSAAVAGGPAAGGCARP